MAERNEIREGRKEKRRGGGRKGERKGNNIDRKDPRAIFPY